MNPTNPSSSPNPENQWNPAGSLSGDLSAQNTEQFASSGSTSSGVGGKAQELKAKASDVATAAKNKLSDTTGHLKSRAAEVAGEQKENVAKRIGGYSSALRDAGRKVEDDDPNIAWVSQQAAERLQRVADYVRQRDYEGLRLDAESIARRHPAILLGSMFFTGLLIGNAFRAGRTALNQADEGSHMSYDSDYAYDPETQPGEPLTSSTPVVPESSEI